MKSRFGRSILAAMIVLSATVTPQADDVEATLTFRGSVVNNPGRQTIQGHLAGAGEYDPIDETANIVSSVRTLPGKRLPLATVLGNYPVLLSFRATRGDEVETDNFKATAIVYRRVIIFRGFGRITLNRPIDPRRPGRQFVSGRGRFEFDE